MLGPRSVLSKTDTRSAYPKVDTKIDTLLKRYLDVVKKGYTHDISQLFRNFQRKFSMLHKAGGCCSKT